MFTEADPDLILSAYREGIFPMADSADALFFNFYEPRQRGQLSIDSLHVPKRLRKTVRQAPYQVTVDDAFEQVIDDCAAEDLRQEQTWINPAIRDVFIKLHEKGYAHSIECWQGKGRSKKLAGGLYGIAIGRVFCGESMVSHATNASKIALVHLCARLWMGGFTVLDTQFTNEHLKQFGVYEIPQKKYVKLIETEMRRRGDFNLKKNPDLNEKDLVEKYLEHLVQKAD